MIYNNIYYYEHPKHKTLYASKCGKILSKTNRGVRLLKEQISDRGYFKIRTSRNRERINIRSHRFVYECIKNVLIDGLEINHIDKNKLNNSIENLEIISRKNNIHHAFFGKKRGFTKNKCNGWDAQININNHIYFIGSYKTKEKAQEKYREIFVEWYGKEPW